jgi:hypothetical protein
MSPVKNGGELIRAGEMAPRLDHGAPKLQAPLNADPPPDTARQTVFNDQNFVPKGARNVVNLRVGSEAPLQKEPSAKAKLTIIRQSPTMKERACWPYKQGSIESRNCRASIGLKYRN